MKISDDKILTALLTHGSPSAAARECGIAVGTVLKRLRTPDFAARYTEAREAVLQSTVSSMTSALSSAVAVLKAVIEDNGISASVRIQAADSLLRHCLRYVEVCELEKRVAKLEKEGENNAESWTTC